MKGARYQDVVNPAGRSPWACPCMWWALCKVGAESGVGEGELVEELLEELVGLLVVVARVVSVVGVGVGVYEHDDGEVHLVVDVGGLGEVVPPGALAVICVCGVWGVASNDVESRGMDVSCGVYGRVVHVMDVCGGDTAGVCSKGHASSTVVGGGGVDLVRSGVEQRSVLAPCFLKYEDVGSAALKPPVEYRVSVRCVVERLGVVSGVHSHGVVCDESALGGRGGGRMSAVVA